MKKTFLILTLLGIIGVIFVKGQETNHLQSQSEGRRLRQYADGMEMINKSRDTIKDTFNI